MSTRTLQQVRNTIDSTLIYLDCVNGLMKKYQHLLRMADVRYLPKELGENDLLDIPWEEMKKKLDDEKENLNQYKCTYRKLKIRMQREFYYLANEYGVDDKNVPIFATETLH